MCRVTADVDVQRCSVAEADDDDTTRPVGLLLDVDVQCIDVVQTNLNTTAAMSVCDDRQRALQLTAVKRRALSGELRDG